MQKQEYTYKEATHYLSCAHQINSRNRNEYLMLCLILKELPNNRAKILVFGDRRKKIEYCEEKQRIRYVSKDRLSVIPQTSPNGDFSNEKEHNNIKRNSKTSSKRGN